MPPLSRPPLTEQQRNLWILRWLGAALGIALAVAVVLLYFGREIPPADMRTYYTSATGYATPPRGGTAPPGSIPRGATLSPEQVGLSEPGPASAGSPQQHGGHAAVPAEAQALRNPLSPTADVLSLGERSYRVNCAMCHGRPGEQIGPVGKRYTPRPPSLAEHVPGHSPGSLFYVISYGIRSTPNEEAAQYLPSQWHAFRAEVSERERWAIVTWLRGEFERKGAKGTHEHGGIGK